jgi:hypothetical protein
MFWIIAAIIIAAVIVAWIFWAGNLGRGYNPKTNVPTTPGYAPATTAGTRLTVPSEQALRPAPASTPGAARASTVLPAPANSPSASTPASSGTH